MTESNGRRPPIGLVLALALTLSGRPAEAAPIRIQATGLPAESAVLELQAEELVTMTPIPFRLWLRDTKGEPLTGAEVSCDLSMPSMHMPQNRPKVTPNGESYEGELVFTCAMGAWRITCEAKGGDGRKQKVSFDIEKVRMK